MHDQTRATSIGERCDALEMRVEYACRQIRDKNETTAARLLAAECLSALSRVLKAVCAGDSGEEIAVRSDALAICETLLSAADAQVSTILASLPPFRAVAPVRRVGFVSGVGPLGIRQDANLPLARQRIIETLYVLRAFVDQTHPFGPNTLPAKFIDALLCADIPSLSAVDNVVQAALRRAQQ